MRISKEQLQKWYVEDKLNQTEIGLLVGVDRKAIDYYLKKYSIPKRSRKEAMRISAEKKSGKRMTAEEIQERVSNGALIKDLVKESGHSRAIFGRILKENGINLRNHDGQRQRQSEFMRSNNPVPKGTKRDSKIMQRLHLSRTSNALKRYEKINDKTTYAKAARYVAYKHFGKGEFIPQGLVIDHMMSINDGWEQGVPVSTISHPANLRLITNEENIQKAAKSILTLEELTKRIGVQRLSILE